MAIKCRRGTPCGGACIRAGAKCRQAFNPAASNALDNVKRKIGLGVKIRNAQRKGDASEEARLRVERNALSGKKGPSALQLELKAVSEKDHQAINPKSPSAKPKAPLSKPDDLYGAWPTNDLQKHRDFLSKRGGGERNLEKANAELDRRAAAAKNKEKSATKPDSRYGKWSEETLKEHLAMIKNVNPGAYTKAHKAEIGRVEKELARRKAGVAAVKPDSAPDSVFGPRKNWATHNLEVRRALLDHPDGSLLNPFPAMGRKEQLGRVEKELERRKKAGPDSASANTKWAKLNAQDFDSTFKAEKHQGGDYNWDETSKRGTKKLGNGSFGEVLLAKGPPPAAVKRGKISSKEAEIIDMVGKADIGPRLIAGDIAAGGRMEYGVKMAKGRIAMSVVPGRELGKRASDTKIGNTTTGDAYWKARADLHRLGVAHNDTHIGNLMIDRTGKGRWVDMGLAQDSPGAALAEALGVLKPPMGSVGRGKGDWQGKRWATQTGNMEGRVTSFAPANLKKIQENHNTKVLPFLRSKGLTDDEINNVMTMGIRQPPTHYVTKPGFSKLGDSAAIQAINLLYDGI
jgi:hypothetical protein